VIGYSKLILLIIGRTIKTSAARQMKLVLNLLSVGKNLSVIKHYMKFSTLQAILSRIGLDLLQLMMQIIIFGK
jgi:hypothetical protein